MKRLIFFLGGLIALTSCKSTTFASYLNGNKLQRAVIAHKLPDSATAFVDFTTLNGYDLEKISIAPSGAFTVISMLKRGAGTPLPTRLEIYSSFTGDLVKDITGNDLKNWITSNTSGSYPSSLKTFNTFDVRWKGENTAVLEVQPVLAGSGIESLPQNVSIVYNISNDKVEDAQFYSRGSSSPISVPNHPNKELYSFSISQGKLQIDGTEVQNMPSGLKQADITVIKE